jgi:hypothetical protein
MSSSKTATHEDAAPAAKRSHAMEGSGVVTRFKLANGVRVLLKPRPDVPLVSMLVAFPGGGRFEPAGKSGLATLTHRALTKGTARFSAEEIASRIEGLGGNRARRRVEPKGTRRGGKRPYDTNNN